ncbi:MAG TPA: DUF4255 domain-containing protein [Gemmatimonadaceae bacterium]|nr:DUF4255 domain-containing protein [Gemmatimonadaceae bacterium]
MSNHLAIATVTAALGQIAQTAAESAVAGVNLRFGRPTAPAQQGERKLHVYLYQVTPNAALRNGDLPTRDSDGRLTRRPQAALDLHYLLSFYGDDQALEPDRMLGAVARDLHARPVLSAQTIQDTIAGHAELTGSDLAAAIETVKFTPTHLSLDDMSRLWSVLVQIPHALSVPYIGTVVLIDALEGGPLPLPVLRRGEQDRGVDTRIGPFPQLHAYWAGAPASSERKPRLPSYPAGQLGARIVLEGANLGGDTVVVRFVHPRLAAAQEIEIAPNERTPTMLKLTLPDDAPAQDAWAAGIYSVAVTCRRGQTAQSSNTVPLVLSPHLTSVTPNPASPAGGSVTLTITCRPRVLPAQRATLLIADREVPAEPHVNPTDTLSFVIDPAPAMNQELVRVRIDGVDSFPFKYDATTGGFVFDDLQRATIT